MTARVLLVAAAFGLAGFQHDATGHTISGRLVDAKGGVPGNVGLCAWVRTGPTSSNCSPFRAAADGSFKSPPLRRAVYALVVGPAPELSMDADVDGALVVVDLRAGDVTGLTVTTGRYALRGKYVMRSDNPAARWPSHLHVTARLAEGKEEPDIASGSQGAPNGEFVLRNTFGKRILRTGYVFDGPDRWWPDAVLLDGVEVTDVPTDFSRKPNAKLEVVFTQHPARVEGTVTAPNGSPPTGAWVVAFSADPAQWQTWGSRTHLQQVGRNGRYSIATRPGRLLVVAVPPSTYAAQGERTPNFATLAPLAQQVTVAARQRIQVDLQVRSDSVSR